MRTAPLSLALALFAALALPLAADGPAQRLVLDASAGAGASIATSKPSSRAGPAAAAGIARFHRLGKSPLIVRPSPRRASS